MKLWLIERTDGHDFDEYDSLVVRAESEEAALTLLHKECWYATLNMNHVHYTDCFTEFRGFKSDGSNAKISEVTADGKPGLIIGSSNAG